MTTAAINALIAGTWRKPMAKMSGRAVTLHDVLPSPGRSAAAWNAYMSSLVPYPAHYIAPSPKEERAMRKHLRVAVGLAGTNWIPVHVMTGLGGSTIPSARLP